MLLRFLQDKKYRRLGENRLRQANIRVIAATNTDLETEVGEGRFRKDLFFRLRVVPVEVPALWHRPEDIPQLVEAFTEKSSIEYKLPAVQFTVAALECMCGYEWPGNVRELENCVAYLTCLQPDRLIEPCDLPLLSSLGAAAPLKGHDNPAVPANGYGESLQVWKDGLVGEFERLAQRRVVRRDRRTGVFRPLRAGHYDSRGHRRRPADLRGGHRASQARRVRDLPLQQKTAELATT